jgi:hypothetical protein
VSGQGREHRSAGSSGSPWADPTTPTEPGPPYAGPPVTGPPAPPYGFGPYGPAPHPAPYGAPPYGAGYPPPYGYPAPWAPGPPPAPRRPGQVIGSAVLAFVQAGLVGLASLYLWFAVSLIGFAAGQAPVTPGSATVQELAADGNVLALLGLLSAVLLVGAGIAGLARRSRFGWLLLGGAHAVQVVLAGYWGIRLYTVLGDVPGTLDEGAFAAFALVFAAAPLVGLGLVLLGPGRRWFDGAAPS